ncbi:transcriptional regulator [Skermanella stibiiresistens SB22]|uniref:Transcriptional regulator n=1 Tax=Skermanella stibiiresistens SB22 TaxID=1385369 RepID=W9H7R2_9PROT|nr:HU family DNA-binding protein [Skermanella stibiiresistens]EWY39838.1 transcriptional regulator [Skermanella stibiiresistens SB22]
MNRAELVAAVADQTGQTKADAGKAVDAAFTVITQALASGDEVKVPNFGSFSVAERAAREGRNPQSGEKITIAASKQAKFSAAKGLKDTLNG